MATFRNRKGSWQAQVKLGKRLVSKSFPTKTEAKVWAAQAEMQGDDTPIRVCKYRPSDVIQKYKDEVIPTKSGSESLYVVFDFFLKQSWAHIPFDKLTTKHLSDWRDLRYKTVNECTVKNNFARLKAAMNYAVNEWQWDIPAHLFASVSLRRVVERDVPRLEDYEIERLMASATTSRNNYLRPLITFALETGMRRGETLKLEWTMVDMKRGWLNLPGRITKSGKPRKIPISDACELALRQIEELSRIGKLVNRRNKFYQTDIGEKRVFPITEESLKACWMRCRQKADMQHLHWHDLRHEAISLLFDIGCTVPEVKSISGHATIDQLDRYSHASASQVLLKVRGGQVHAS